MTNFKFIAATLLLGCAFQNLNAQQITGSSVFSPTPGGARILSAQGDTPDNPAIGFHASPSTTTTAKNDGGGGNGIFRPTSNTMAFATASLERMRLNVSGNLGIGTSSPLARLHVSSNGAVNQFKIERTDSGNQNNSLDIRFTGSPTNNLSIPAGSTIFSTTNPTNLSDILFMTTPQTPSLIMKANGNVGIGTTMPKTKFHLHEGVLMISGQNPFGGPMITFSDNIADNMYPNGRWGIEYSPVVGGLNFWKPWNPSTGGGGNYYMLLKDDGKIGMGIDPGSCANAFPGNYRLYVNGGILSTGLKVANFCTANWADYVFESNYKLKSLEEVEAYVKENKHLPNIPSANEIEKNGLDVPQIQAKQMEKIEELTLYLIEMKKEINQLKEENKKLQNQILNK